MKYMHFRASCSYTALALILEFNGIETEDYKIAKDIFLPWLFTKEDDSYISGPMLQGAKWFNLWLLPRGMKMEENTIYRDQLCKYLRDHSPLMLGIQTPCGKHAVVFTEFDGRYHFMNPTYESSGEDNDLYFSETELLSRVGEKIVVGEVFPTEPKTVMILPLLYDSISVLRENCAEIEAFSAETHNPNDYFPKMNSLFRPLLLDGITMLELAEESAFAQEFTVLQQQFMAFMHGSREEPLQEILSLEKLHKLTEQYIRLIEKQIQVGSWKGCLQQYQ